MSEPKNIEDSFEFISLKEATTLIGDEKTYVMVEDVNMGDQAHKYAILLNSTVGYKVPSLLKDAKNFVLGKPKQYSQKNIISGTLLEALSEKEILLLASHFDPILNYKVLSSDHTIWLRCESKHVKGLTQEELKYLQAVEGFNDRVEALPKLDWIGSLHEGSGAFLNMPTVFGCPIKVTIRYIGSLPNGDNSGTHFGIELLEQRGHGNTNGNFQDHQLFDCTPNCGLFVSMEKLMLTIPEKPLVKHQPRGQGGYQLQRHPSVQHPLRQESVTDSKPFEKMDRVMAYDVNGVPEKGTVKWIGRNETVLSNGAYIVGIYTDKVIHKMKDRFPHHITSMNNYIQPSKEHSSLFLPEYTVRKVEDQASNGGAVGHGHNYDTRFSHHNCSYNPQDSVSATVANEAKQHGMSTTMMKENQKEAYKVFEDAKKAKEAIKSNERRYQMQQTKNELQIGEIEGFDDTMLDIERQKKIMEDLKRQNQENQLNASQLHKANTTYNETSPTIPQSHSTTSGYQHDQQLQDKQQITQDPRTQGVRTQDVHSQGNYQPDVTQQVIFSQNTPQQEMYPPSQGKPPYNSSSQYNIQQGMALYPPHGMPQQDIHLQKMYQQGMPLQGIMSQQGMHYRDVHPHDQYPYQHGVPESYQTQPYNQPPINSNWHGENPPYAMERQQSQQSVEFNQILRAGTNEPNDNYPRGTFYTNPAKQCHNASQDIYGPPEPYRQMEESRNMLPLELEDAVQSGNNPILYGTIKWIGELPGSVGLIAGVEMEDPVAGATDGWHDRCQYFVCKPGRGVFLRFAALRRDDRFISVKSQAAVVQNPLGKFDLNSSIKSKTFIQPPSSLIETFHTGEGKGIQGHQNSCYLDSTLYGLFAFSGAFDDLFLEESADEIGMTIKSTLQSIVNTLRHNNVVLYDHIMILREELDKLQHIKGLKSEEKDPEEFLNLLFKHVLNVEAFLRIKRPFGTDKEFFVQLFVEGNKHHIPATQDLLTEMFIDQQITFAKYPLRLLLQIPRYGKKFKTFKGVIPSLELDVTTLCEQYVGNCMVCGKRGTEFCPDCVKQEIKENSSYFCNECVKLWHSHRDRRHHKPVSKQPSNDGGDPGRLRLLSVLCIETSHYVCFTRVQGSGTNEWVFFDSMAERPNDVHNIPRVTQCTQELNDWVYGTKDLKSYTSKELPQLVRRFVEDGYLCIYVDQDGIMYGDDGGTP